jgi:dual specificity tyrosine-phosphorylation-regulated kinase 1
MLRRSRGGQNYSFSHGELLNNKYRLASLLGSGSFSQVVRAQDLTNREVDVAVKIVKTGNPYQHQASVEMNILRELHAKDPLDEYNIVRMVGSFTHLGHQCIVFERLSINLYQYLKNTRSPTNHNRYHGVSLNLVRTFGRQLLETLTFLSRTDVSIIHCDLKPENILLRNLKQSYVKVVDFGSSCKSESLMYAVVQSRFYRSPEVLLGMKYGLAIDVWSLGCMLVEMHSGATLFQGKRDEEQLYKIIEIFGMIPPAMIELAKPSNRDIYFDKPPGSGSLEGEGGKEDWILRQCPSPIQSSGQSSNAFAQVHLSTRVRVKRSTETELSYNYFEELIRDMLRINPEERITAKEALAHPFFQEQQ